MTKQEVKLSNAVKGYVEIREDYAEVLLKIADNMGILRTNPVVLNAISNLLQADTVIEIQCDKQEDRTYKLDEQSKFVGSELEIAVFFATLVKEYKKLKKAAEEGSKNYEHRC